MNVFFADSKLKRSMLLLVVILLASLSVQAAGQLYRYMNEKGIPVIDDNVPPEFVAGGYDIISTDGSIIRRIPRQLSDDELRLRNTDESRARFQQEEEARMQAWDESLLLRYSDIDDIEAAQKRALRDLNIRISILKSNLYSMKAQVEREQQKAADIERRGVDVPVELNQNINTMRLEIEDTEQSISVRREEIESVNAAYGRDINRFETLLGRVEMRRQQSQSRPVSPAKNSYSH
ncbi:MAG: hypothetical protein V7459_02045 [Oceanicoccus sp.]